MLRARVVLDPAQAVVGAGQGAQDLVELRLATAQSRMMPTFAAKAKGWPIIRAVEWARAANIWGM